MVATGLDLNQPTRNPRCSNPERKKADGLAAQITVTRDARIENPIHLCMGVLHDTGRQRIQLHVRSENDSSAKIVAHCFFPRAQNVEHMMDAAIEIESGAELGYAEGIIMAPSGASPSYQRQE
jgi:Fe-S cluster assembly scaffold protein SufB